MNRSNGFKKGYFSRKGLLIAMGVACCIVTMGNVAAGTIAQAPLFITTSLDPNIMFILDDSGSMDWSYLPDTISGDCSSNKCDNYGGLSSARNSAYYDPTITYSPPLNADGTSLGNATFGSAWIDGYKLPHSSKSSVVDLNISYQPTWSDPAKPIKLTKDKAYYYQFIPSSNCIVASSANSNCFQKQYPSTAVEKQNFANWYSYYRTRLMMAKAGISRAFAQLGPTVRVGYGRINNATAADRDGKNIDTVERGVRVFSGKDRSDFFDWLFARTANDRTPLRRALDSAGLYYENENSKGPWSSTPGATGGSLLSCRQSYTVLMTDGYWNDAAATTTGAQADNDGTKGSTITDGTTASFTYLPVSPFIDDPSVKGGISNSLADVAMYYWKRDLCSNIANKVPTSKLDSAFWQHMVIYGIGLGVPTQVQPQDAFGAIGSSTTSIIWPNPDTANTQTQPGIPARIDDLLHAAVNSRGGFFNAKNPDDFAAALKSTLDKIVNSDASSASAVAANSTQLKTGTQVYQALFDPKNWSGDLLTYSIDSGTPAIPATSTTPAVAAVPSTGALTLVSGVNAAALLPSHIDRHIYTFNPLVSAGNKGIPFKWVTLTSTPAGKSQQDYLNKLAGVIDGNGALRVEWLRGDDTHEKTTANTSGIFRDRTTFLGDIVNSDPIYVGNEDHGYSALPGYKDFLATTRRHMLYVGANDGMLHGFDADSSTGRQEIFAYIPNALFPELSWLTSPTYSHQYYVDGTAGVGDVYDGTTWHTVLAGATGEGGRAIFGLDVTNPDVFSESSVLWEFTNINDADLGYTLAQPSVVRLQDGHWAVIVANGYNSDNGHAVLFVLDALTGKVLQKIDTGAGSFLDKNGLSTPIAVDTNKDSSVDTIYAGDLYGNLWKFNVAGNAGSYPVPSSPLFVACAKTGTTCSAADRQPITGKPNVGSVGAAGTDQNGVGTMVYFGTGKYFEIGDSSIATNPQIQTFYGLWDTGLVIADRLSLQEQSIDFEGFATTLGGAASIKPIRVVSKNPVCYSAISTGCTSGSILKTGWALNLLKPVNIAQGERVISFPLVRRGLVIFSTVIPDPDPCLGGGKSRLMEVDAFSGGSPGGSPFDANGDGKVDDNDKVKINGKEQFVSGIDLDIGIIKTPTVIESDKVDFKYVSGSTGAMGRVTDAGCTGCNNNPVTGGVRRSWRQLK